MPKLSKKEKLVRGGGRAIFLFKKLLQSLPAKAGKKIHTHAEKALRSHNPQQYLLTQLDKFEREYLEIRPPEWKAELTYMLAVN